MSGTTEESANARAIRPFTIEIPEAEVETLRSRIAATRWPEKETVADQSQGVQLATTQKLVRYWASGYDWRRRPCCYRTKFSRTFSMSEHLIDLRSDTVTKPSVAMRNRSSASCNLLVA